MKQCNVQYDKENNIIKFDIKSKDVLPAYLHYVLMYNNLPETATLQFKDKTVKLVKIDQEYKFERIRYYGRR